MSESSEEATTELASVDRLLLATSPAGMVVHAGDGRVMWCNVAAERLLGLTESQILGRTPPDPRWRAIQEDGTDYPDISHPAMVVLATGDPVVDVVMGISRPDGLRTWLLISALPITDDPSESEPAVLMSLSSITEQIRQRDVARDAEERLQLMLANSSDIVFTSDADRRVTWIAPTVTRILGYEPSELIGTRMADLWRPEAREATERDRELVFSGEEPRREGPYMFELRAKSGVYRWMSGTSHPLTDAHGQPIGAVSGMQDVTGLMRANQRFTLLAENATDVVYQNDLAGKIAWISPGVRDTLGWEPDDLLGTRSLDLIHPDDLEEMLALRKSTLAGGTGVVRPTRYRTKSGAYRWMSARTRPVADDTGSSSGLVVGLRDIHAERVAHDELSFLAYHDPLTGLRNRAWVLDILDTDLAVARRDHTRLAVLFLDLDHFKVVNDSLGHVAGDDILVAAAHRISQALRPGDRIGRFGGDEFIVIASGVRRRREVEAIATRITASVTKEIAIGAQSVVMSASIGIAMSNADSTSTSLLRDADSALFRAKAKGRSRWEFFDPKMHAAAMARLVTEAELRTAIAEHQFVVHYQPIVSLADATIVGHEALVRWNHPGRGLVPPMEFLPIAEETGLIVEIGDEVIDQVCALMRSRPDLPGPISVNLSPVQITRPGWDERLLTRIRAHEVDPRRLVVEITETAILSVLERTKQDIAHLRDQGIGIHIDDFGTGYSSIALLRDVPVTGLKLDLSFTRHLTTDATARALAAGLAGLAAGLNLDGIAEGIETPEHAEILRQQGWTHGQGYLYGRPAPIPPA
jgi:diguanylate cyclase (GGDEF)-like protein/PAS domain S-box-containing protein